MQRTTSFNECHEGWDIPRALRVHISPEGMRFRYPRIFTTRRVSRDLIWPFLATHGSSRRSLLIGWSNMKFTPPQRFTSGATSPFSPDGAQNTPGGRAQVPSPVRSRLTKPKYAPDR